MGFSLSGRVAGGAQDAVAEQIQTILAQKKFEEQIRAQQAQEQMAQQQLALGTRRQNFAESQAEAEAQQAAIEDMRAQQEKQKVNLTRLQNDADFEQGMTDTSLPAIQRIVLMRRGGVTGLRPEDLMSPEDRATEAEAKHKAELADYEEKRKIDAKYRPAPAPKQTGPGGLSPAQLSTAKQFQDDYARDSKNYITVRNAYQQVKGAATKPDAAGDLSLIFGYMKMLDPNSVVRETEFANAQNAAGIPDQIRNAWNRALSGERLNPNQRQQFVGQAERIWQSAHGNQSRVRKTYGDRATKFGLDPSMVLDDEEPLNDTITKEQVNKRTGERRTIVSTDGGKTWQVKQ